MGKKEIKKYEEKAKEYYNDKQWEHVCKVRDISRLLCNIAGIEKKDAQIVELAALLHDIGKGKKHNEISADYIEGKNLIDDDFLNKKVAKIVRYHRGKKVYKKDFDKKEKKLIAVVRLADKIAKIYKHKHNPQKSLKKLDECIEKLPGWVNK